MKKVSAFTRPIGAFEGYYGYPFSSALSIMSYWRDEAAHGRTSEIGEINAWAALTQLLQLAQYSEKNWSRLSQKPI